MTVEGKTKKKLYRNIIIGVLSFVGVVVIGTGTYLAYLYNKADDVIQKISSPAEVAPAQTAPPPSESTEELEEAAFKPLTFLLAGIDYRKGSDGTMNTDAIILASVNPKTHAATFLSIPRDLQVKVKGMSAHKINYFYAHYFIKDKKTAIANTKQLFSDLFQVPIDYMAIINFDGLRQAVDAVGGLEIDVKMDMRYRDTADGTNINLKKGLQTLDGQQVLDYIRYRKSNQGTSESSDFARNERQQQVMKQILDKLASFEGVTQWGKVLDIIGENVKTDVSESYLRQWIHNYKKIKPDQIDFLQVEGRWKSPYVYLNEDELSKALSALYARIDREQEKTANLAEVFGVFHPTEKKQGRK